MIYTQHMHTPHARCIDIYSGVCVRFKVHTRVDLCGLPQFVECKWPSVVNWPQQTPTSIPYMSTLAT